MYAWASLILAGIFEVFWAISMKYSAGFSKFWPSVIMVFMALLSIGFLTYALKFIAISVAYPIWVSIGAVGVVLVGIFWFKEPGQLMHIVFIAMIIGGTLGLKILHQA